MTTGVSLLPGPLAPLTALCAVARIHQIAADPDTLAHQLGIPPSGPVSTSDVLRAAKHLGLTAKLSRTSIDRLGLTPMPALALMKGSDDSLKLVILAQSDGKRVLFQDTSTPNGRPTIEPVEVFETQWTGELILITSRASLAGALAKFDFTWFIPSLIKYRKLLGEVLLISFMLQLFGLVSPLFFQVVMDKVLVHKGMTTLDVLVIGLVIVVVFESVLNALRAYVFSHTTSRIDVELGARLFRHLIQLPLSYFQARRVGDSIARVRELENIIEHGVALATGNTLTVDLLPATLTNPIASGSAESPIKTLEALEREHIQKALEHTGGNRALAAQLLGIDRVSLWRKLRRYNEEN